MIEREIKNPEEGKETYRSQIHVRSKIVEILTKVETRQAYSDKLLENELKNFEEVDRRFITEVVNGVLRWQGRLDWYIQHLYSGEFENLIIEVRNNLRSSLYQLIFLDKIPPYAVLYEAVEIAKNRYNQKTANLVNAILRNFLRQQRKFDFLETQLDVLDKLALRYSHPRWLVQRWIEYWGIDEVQKLLEANNERPRISVRLNQLRADKEQFFRTLEDKEISYEIHPDFDNYIWIDNFQEFRKLPFLSQGWVTVQDVSTALPVLALDPQPGEWILDMTSAPGGKTGFIAEKMQNSGVLLALDRHYSRVKFTRDNMQRLGYIRVFSVTADAFQLPTNRQFDRILLDAPCSGFGVLRKRVDLKWKRTLQDILNMKRLQFGLLDVAAQNIREGGIIVYSTCTIELEENDRVVEEFLSNHPEFELENLTPYIPSRYLDGVYFIRTFPHRHHMDGSFAVRFRRKN